MRAIASTRNVTSCDPVTVRVVEGPSTGRVFRVPAGTWTIGRSAAASLVVDDPDIALHHACLTVQDDWVRVEAIAGEVHEIAAGSSETVVDVGGSRIAIERRSGAVATQSASNETISWQPPRWRLVILVFAAAVVASLLTGSPKYAIAALTMGSVTAFTWMSSSESRRPSA